MSRAITRSEAIELELVLGSHVRTGEDFADALRRIIRERDLAIYDLGKAQHAEEEEKITRRVFFAACLSQPDQMLRISRLALAAIDGEHAKEFEMKTFEDPSSDEHVYLVYRKRPSASNYVSQYDR